MLFVIVNKLFLIIVFYPKKYRIFIIVISDKKKRVFHGIKIKMFE